MTRRESVATRGRVAVQTRGLAGFAGKQAQGLAFLGFAFLGLAFLALMLVLAGLGAAAANETPQGLVPTAQEDEAIECLALNIYHEARGEPEAGKIAVGHVVLNRSSDASFPRTVCEVVRQGGTRSLHRCQFSWWCDGLSDRPRDQAAWDEARRLARAILAGEIGDPTAGALWYHADYVQPSWSQVFTRGPVIGRHVFYRRPMLAEAGAAVGSESSAAPQLEPRRPAAARPINDTDLLF